MNRLQRLEARRDRGLARPGMVRTRTVNLASVSTIPDRVRYVLHASTGSGPREADLIFAVECGDLTISKALDPAVWQVVQFGRSITNEGERVARSGCALIARRSVVRLDKPRLRVGSPAGEGVRTRYVLSARATFHPGTASAWRQRVRVGHAPPPRAPFGRGRFLDLLERLFGIRAGDLNISAETARRRFRLMRVRSAGVLHMVIPRWVPASEARRLDVGSDHRALDVTLWPRGE